MDPTTKEMWQRNAAQLLKTATFWTATAVSTLASMWVALPVDQQQAVLAALPVPRWLVPFLVAWLPIAVARVWPQRSLSEPVDIRTDAPVRTQPFER